MIEPAQTGLTENLLINFGETHLKNGIERIVNGLPEESLDSLGTKLTVLFATFATFA